IGQFLQGRILRCGAHLPPVIIVLAPIAWRGVGTNRPPAPLTSSFVQVSWSARALWGRPSPSLWLSSSGEGADFLTAFPAVVALSFPWAPVLRERCARAP